MRWKKLGLVWGPDGRSPWAKTHAMAPTPVLLNDKLIRVFVTCLDEKGRGRPGYVDVSAADPTRVLGSSPEPLLDIGVPGSFDDNGLVAMCLLRPEPETLYMYYAGFEICTHIRFRSFTGLAVSRDGGRTFSRHSRAPLLDRSDEELYFRGSPFVMIEEGLFKFWYGSGSDWIDVSGKSAPVYDIRYQESKDGFEWGPRGRIAVAVTDAEEHGFGRPWVVKRGPADYQLFYSVRRRSLGAYRLGYAESEDGVHWVRKDGEMGLDVSPGGFDSDAIMYSAVLPAGGKTYCFYNGNHFGKEGFAVSELLS